MPLALERGYSASYFLPLTAAVIILALSLGQNGDQALLSLLAGLLNPRSKAVMIDA
jgi:hypothetical protein